MSAAAAGTTATVPGTAPVILSTTNESSSSAAVPAISGAQTATNEKRGRFNLVPASVSPNAASVPSIEAVPEVISRSAGGLTVPPIDEKAERKSMSDDEVLLLFSLFSPFIIRVDFIYIISRKKRTLIKS